MPQQHTRKFSQVLCMSCKSPKCPRPQDGHVKALLLGLYPLYQIRQARITSPPTCSHCSQGIKECSFPPCEQEGPLYGPASWVGFSQSKRFSYQPYYEYIQEVGLWSPMLLFVGLAYQGKNIVFRFIIEYSSFNGFWPLVNRSIFI